MILAGDIGGTNARLGCFTLVDGNVVQVKDKEKDYPSREHAGLDEIVKKFLTDYRVQVERACFGIAGPVKKGRVMTPNLPWVVDASELRRLLGIQKVALINDLEANTYGIAALQAEDFVVLNEGAPDAEGNIAVIAAGTGLGEAGGYWDGRMHHPIPSEGGHADFAPSNALEAELFLKLLEKFGHVSYERVLSGAGLLEIYKFLLDRGGAREPEWLTREMEEGDPSAVISKAGLQGRSNLCERALDIFASIYGAQAGNLALNFKATGGVFVGGGIAPKIVEKLKGPTFMEAFKAKGRLRKFVEAIPVRVILNDKTALLGAARRAVLQ